MKTLSSGLAAELAKKTGCAPVWILQLTINSVDYFLSDNAFTLTGWNSDASALPWVSSWGQVYEQLSGAINEIRVADLQLELVIDPDASPNAEDLATATDLEKSPAILYLWAHGLDASVDPPQEMGRFYVRDVVIPDETRISITLEDSTVRLTNIVGEVVNQDDWASVDPDDVGKIFPLPFGVVQNVPGRATVAGLLTTLVADITAAATTFDVARPDGIVAGKVFRIDAEDVYVSGISGDTLTVTRGYNSTTAVVHSAGDRLLERLSMFVFVVSGHALTSIDKVCILAGGTTEIDITDQCTRYTGDTGDQYSGYGSRAVVTISQAQADVIQARVLSAGVLTLNDSGHGHSMSNVSTSVRPDSWVYDPGTDSDWYLSPNLAIDGNLSVGAVGAASNDNSVDFRSVVPVGNTGTPVRFRAACHAGDASNSGSAPMKFYHNGSLVDSVTVGGSSESTFYTDWETFSSWSDLNHSGTKIRIEPGTSANSRIWEVWFEVDYNPSPPSNTSGVTGSVNSVADAILGGPVVADVTAVASDPDAVIGALLDTWGGISSTTLDGTLPASYRFDGVVLEAISLVDLVSRLAFQCRCFFRIAGAGVRLVYRPDSLSSEKTIAACRVQDGRKVLARRKTEASDVINVVNLRFDRDWTLPQGVDGYRLIESSSDATSIADYGEQESPELFLFDFVVDATMAADLCAFYLAEYKRRKWLYEFEVFLDHAELEFGDDVTLGFAGSQVVKLMQVGCAPGSVDRMDAIRMIGRG